MKILVAEDDFTMRHLIGKVIIREHMDCKVAADGKQVLEAWEKEPFDCILMDVQMPVMDGLQATRIIRERERERGGHTIIIAVTAFAADSDRTLCLNAGMDDYISKPVDVGLLLSLMRKHAIG